MKYVNVLVKLIRQFVEAQQQREKGTGKPTTRSAPRNKRVTDRVQIEYRPEIDGDGDPGEVVWTWVPYEEDASKGKDRPVVIVGRIGDDFAGVPLTSKKKNRADQIPVGTGSWDSQGRPSYAKVDRLLTVDPDDIRREGAILARDRFDDVVTNLRRYHDI